MNKVMKLLPMRFTKKLIKILIILLVSYVKVDSKPTIEDINLFSFKHNDQCIYFFDFSLHKKKINKLKSKKKDQFIINLMIESLYNKDFKRCEDVNEILFKEVMIEAYNKFVGGKIPIDEKSFMLWHPFEGLIHDDIYLYNSIMLLAAISNEIPL